LKQKNEGKKILAKCLTEANEVNGEGHGAVQKVQKVQSRKILQKAGRERREPGF
jgi:hypothetical protein